MATPAEHDDSLQSCEDGEQDNVPPFHSRLSKLRPSRYFKNRNDLVCYSCFLELSWSTIDRRYLSTTQNVMNYSANYSSTNFHQKNS